MNAASVIVPFRHSEPKSIRILRVDTKWGDLSHKFLGLLFASLPRGFLVRKQGSFRNSCGVAEDFSN